MCGTSYPILHLLSTDLGFVGVWVFILEKALSHASAWESQPKSRDLLNTAEYPDSLVTSAQGAARCAHLSAAAETQPATPPPN